MRLRPSRTRERLCLGGLKNKAKVFWQGSMDQVKGLFGFAQTAVFLFGVPKRDHSGFCCLPGGYSRDRILGLESIQWQDRGVIRL